MKSPPDFILIENVVGFEGSATREALSQVLAEAHYHFQEFVLSPTNFGTPYSRPRYFGLARKVPFTVQKRFHAPWTCTPQALLDTCTQGHTELSSSPHVRILGLMYAPLMPLHAYATGCTCMPRHVCAQLRTSYSPL